MTCKTVAELRVGDVVHWEQGTHHTLFNEFPFLISDGHAITFVANDGSMWREEMHFELELPIVTCPPACRRCEAIRLLICSIGSKGPSLMAHLKAQVIERALEWQQSRTGKPDGHDAEAVLLNSAAIDLAHHLELQRRGEL